MITTSHETDICKRTHAHATYTQACIHTPHTLKHAYIDTHTNGSVTLLDRSIRRAPRLVWVWHGYPQPKLRP